MDSLSDYSLPATWRGVASPRYLRLARWLSLVEELGGVRGMGPCGQDSLGSILTGTACEAGKVDMNLLTITPDTEQLSELSRFVTANFSRHERLVIMLFYADGLSLAEIAQVLDLPEATVAALFSKSLDVLREHFG